MARKRRLPSGPWVRAVLRGLGKGALWSLALLVAVAAGAAYLLVQYAFPPEKLTPLVAEQLRRTLRREVEVESVRWLPFRGIRMSELTVKNRPGFDDQDFIDCRLVVAKPDWLSLARGRVAISELHFWSPVIRLSRSPEGEWNVADLGRGGGGAAAFGVLRIHDAALEVDDRLKGVRQAVRGFELSLDEAGEDGATPFRLDLTFEYRKDDKQLDAELTLKGAVEDPHLGWTGARLVLDRGVLRLGPIGLEGTGTLAGGLAPVLDLDFQTGTFRPDGLTELFPALANLSLPPAAGELHMSFSEPRAFSVTNLRVEAGAVSLFANGSVNLSTGTLQVRASTNQHPLEEAARFWAPLAPFGLGGEAQWSVSLSGALGDVAVDKLLVSLRDAELRRGGLAVKGLRLDLNAADNFAQAEGQVDGGELDHHGQKLTGLQADATLSDGKLVVSRAEAAWNGHPMRLKARVDKPFSPERVAVDGELTRFQLDELVQWITDWLEATRKAPARPDRLRGLGWLRIFRGSLLKDFPVLAGDLRASELDHPNWTGRDLRLAWHLDGLTQGMKELQGRILIDVKDGRVHDLPNLMKHDFLRYVFLPFETVERLNKMGYFKPATPGDLPFERISASYRFTNGAMFIDHFFVQGTEITATAEGELDWIEERMLLHVVTRVNKTGMGAPESLSDEKGRPTLSFFVEGPMLGPTIRLDLQKVKAGEIERFIEEGLREGRASVQEVRKDLW